MTDSRSPQRTRPAEAGPLPEPPELTEASREDEEDNDTLTYNEVAIRLHLEIRAEQTKLAGATGAEAGAIEARIAALREAAERNSPDPDHDRAFEHLFGFPPVHQPPR